MDEINTLPHPDSHNFDNEELLNAVNDLISIIQFTENVSVKIHDCETEEQIYNTVITEFGKSQRFLANVLILSDDKKSLRIFGMGKNLQRVKIFEQILRLELKDFYIDLNKSTIFHDVVFLKMTHLVKIENVLNEIFSQKTAALVINKLGFDETMAILSPIEKNQEVIGVLVVIAPGLADFFVSSVKNLVSHISTAIELVAMCHCCKEQQNNLDLSVKKYWGFIKNFHGIAFQGTLDWKPLFLHGALQEITGYSEQELLNGKPDWKEIIYPDDFKKLIKSDDEKKLITIPNYIVEREYRIIRKTGEIRWIKENISNITDSSDQPIYVQGTIFDITAKKELERTHEEQEQELHTIFQQANDGIAYIDIKGRIIDANKKAIEIFGGTRHDLIGKHFTKIGTLHPKDLPRLIVRFGHLINGKKQPLNLWIHNKQGKNIFLECSGTLIKRKDRSRVLVVIVRDITKRKQTEEKLEETVNKLDEINKNLENIVDDRTAEIERLLTQKDEFIHMLAHDLKNPLTPLVTLLPIIHKKEQDQKLKYLLSTTIESTNSIRDLVEKTLKLAVVNAPDLKFSYEALTLNTLIEQNIQCLKPLFSENKIKIKNTVDSTIKVVADKLRLKEVIDNLLINAVKYSPNYGEITIRANEEDESVVVSIHDSGIGMKSNQIKHIFDPFYKADESRHDLDSSGLGLTICKRIVEKHGGRIWAESPGSGKGSTFYFSLKKKSYNQIMDIKTNG